MRATVALNVLSVGWQKGEFSIKMSDFNCLGYVGGKKVSSV